MDIITLLFMGRTPEHENEQFSQGALLQNFGRGANGKYREPISKNSRNPERFIG